MVKVKVCGITNVEDAAVAVEAGADALGFVLYAGSPRNISPENAGRIIATLPPFIAKVGVFVDAEPDFVRNAVAIAGFTSVQLHGAESPDYCAIFDSVIKGIRVRGIEDLGELGSYKVSAFLLDAYSPDAYGGTGMVFNWDIAVEAKRMGRVILAGGLTPDNVGKAVRFVRPYAVDVSSGVELTKGVKDHAKVRAFIREAKAAGH